MNTFNCNQNTVNSIKNATDRGINTLIIGQPGTGKLYMSKAALELSNKDFYYIDLGLIIPTLALRSLELDKANIIEGFFNVKNYCKKEFFHGREISILKPLLDNSESTESIIMLANQRELDEFSNFVGENMFQTIIERLFVLKLN